MCFRIAYQFLREETAAFRDFLCWFSKEWKCFYCLKNLCGVCLMWLLDSVLCAAWHSKYSAVFPPVGKVMSSQRAFNNLLSKSPEAHFLLIAHCSILSLTFAERILCLGTPMMSAQVGRRSHQITSSQPQQRQLFTDSRKRLLTIFFSLFSSRFLSSWACFSSASFFWRSSSWAFNWAWMR